MSITVNIWMTFGYLIAVLIYAAPIIMILIMRLLGARQIGNALIGICVYINFFGLIYLVLFCNLLGGNVPFLKGVIDHPLGSIVLGSILGGLICEAGRYLALRFVVGEPLKWYDSVGLGAGCGLAATFGLVTDSVTAVMMVNYVMVSSPDGKEETYFQNLTQAGVEREAAANLLRQVSEMHFYDGFLYVFQILMLIVFSIAASILILGVVRKNTLFSSFPILGFWLAVLTHVAADGMPLLLSRVLNLSPYVVILYMIVATAAAFFFILYSLRKYPGEGLKAALGEGKKKKESKKNPSSEEEHPSSIAAVASKKTADIDPDEKNFRSE